MQCIYIPQLLSCLLRRILNSLAWAEIHDTAVERFSLFCWLNMFSILICLEPEPLQNDFSHYNPHLLFFWTSFFLSFSHTHTPQICSYCILSSLWAHQQSSWVVWHNPSYCRQPVGISLTAWQTAILNTTRTHTGKGRYYKCIVICILTIVRRTCLEGDWKT